jgi:hypothetical protein
VEWRWIGWDARPGRHQERRRVQPRPPAHRGRCARRLPGERQRRAMVRSMPSLAAPCRWGERGSSVVLLT